MALINRNGQAYSGGDVLVAMFGCLDYEVTAIEYNTKQAHTANYSLGSNDPSSYSIGKKEHSGSVTLRLRSASEIEKACGGDLLKIRPFQINVTFVNEDNSIINDTVTAKFMSTGRSVGDDDDIKQQYELFVLGVDLNNV